MTTQTDDFNRSNGAVGSNWTRTVNNSGAAEIYSNRFRLTAGGYQAYVYTGGTALGANQAVEAKVYFPGNGGVILLARASGTDGNSYGLYLPYTGEWELDILDASGAPTTQLASGTVSIVAGAVLKLVANGTTLKGYYNGVEIASVTDSTRSTGRTGVYFAAPGNAVEVDDFSATDELGGVSVALSGTSSTSSAGTAGVAHEQAVTGSSVTASAGTLTPSVGASAALTGEQVSASAGTAVPASAVAVTGSQVSASAGTVAPGASAALSGTQVAASAGTVSVGAAAALTGGAATASAGTAAPQASVAVTGASSTVAAGTLTASAGSSVSVALTGASATASAGSLAVGLSVAAQGSEATVSAGTVTASSGVAVALSGASVTASAGTVGGRTDLGLTGIDVSGLAGSLETSGGVAAEAYSGGYEWRGHQTFAEWQRKRREKEQEQEQAEAKVVELRAQLDDLDVGGLSALVYRRRAAQIESQIRTWAIKAEMARIERERIEARRMKVDRNNRAIFRFLASL